MYDLAIATTTYFQSYGYVSNVQHRLQCWTWFCDSIIETYRDGRKIILVVSDDGSPGTPPKRFFPFDTEFFYHREHRGIPFNFPWTVQHASQYAPWVLNVDSDGYFHPEWLRWLFDAMKYWPEETAFNLFNSPRQTEVIEELDGCLIKGSSQEHGRVFRSQDLNDCANWTSEEWAIRHIPTNKRILVPKVSMIQHTGCYGLNNVPGGSQDYDPLFPLNHLCGLGLTETVSR